MASISNKFLSEDGLKSVLTRIANLYIYLLGKIADAKVVWSEYD